MYEEYVELLNGHSKGEGHVSSLGNNVSPLSSRTSGWSLLMNYVREQEAVPAIKSELEVYLEEPVYIPKEIGHTSFCALEWWKVNSGKFRILSQMAADVLAIPISTVASESTFSAGGRVIDTFRASLSPDTIQALICGGDWLRVLHGLKKNSKVYNLFILLLF